MWASSSLSLSLSLSCTLATQGRQHAGDSLLTEGSPLLDLPPLALPGLPTRVMSGRKTVRNIDDVERFVSSTHLSDKLAEDKICEIDEAYTGPLVKAAVLAVLPALQYGAADHVSRQVMATESV